MRNLALAHDYLRRAHVRLRALAVLHEGESWPDVVREAQEVVELTLKALLRASGVDAPRVHDVSPLLEQERSRLPDGLAPFVDELAFASKQLRRDRELAFYGAEDLTPGDFYTRVDADRALAAARRVVELVARHVPERS
jgi:HEPN domain-containing protein